MGVGVTSTNKAFMRRTSTRYSNARAWRSIATSSNSTTRTTRITWWWPWTRRAAAPGVRGRVRVPAAKRLDCGTCLRPPHTHLRGQFPGLLSFTSLPTPSMSSHTRPGSGTSAGGSAASQRACALHHVLGERGLVAGGPRAPARSSAAAPVPCSIQTAPRRWPPPASPVVRQLGDALQLARRLRRADVLPYTCSISGPSPATWLSSPLAV